MSNQRARTGSRPKAIRRSSLHDETVSVVREMILDGTLKPGTRIAEQQLCKDLGISRTPLREALKVLAVEGLVALMPNQGASVTEVTREDIEAVFELMYALEDQIGRLAVMRATDEDLSDLRKMHEQMMGYHQRGRRTQYFDLNQQIHLRLAESTGNRFLIADYARYLAKIRRARYLANLSQDRWDESMREHEDIMTAFTSLNGVALARNLREHSQRTAKVVVAALDAQKLTGVSESTSEMAS